MAVRTPSSSSQFNLVADALALGISPSALMRRAYAAWHEATDFDTPKGRAQEGLLREMQRAYKRQYQVFLHEQRAALARKRTALAGERAASAAKRVARAEAQVARKQRAAGVPPLTEAEVKGVQDLNVQLARVAAEEWAVHPNNPSRKLLVPAEAEADIAKRINARSGKRPSEQRQVRGDIAQADVERIAIEAPVAKPALTGADAFSVAMDAVALLKQLPPEMRAAVLKAAAK